MKKIAGLLIVLTLFAIGSVTAQPKKGFKQKRDGIQFKMAMKFADEIELTDSQKDQLEDMMVDFKVERIDIEADVKKESVILKSLMRDDDASDSEVYRQIDKVADLKAQSQKMKFDHKNKFRSVFTDEQIEKLEGLKKNQRGKRFDGRRGGPRGGQRGQCDGHGPKGSGKADCDGNGPHGPRGFGHGQGPHFDSDGEVEYEVKVEKKIVEPEDDGN